MAAWRLSQGASQYTCFVQQSCRRILTRTIAVRRVRPDWVLSRRWSSSHSRPPVTTPKLSRQSRGSSTQGRGHLLLLIIPVTTFCLGTWQIFRLQWKLDLIEQLEKKTRRPPTPITTDIFEHLDELEYSRVTLTGYFDHTRELYMWPRTLYSAHHDKKNQNTEPGACIVTPFFCRELGQWVLVNRGWVPRRKMDPSTRPKGQIDGEVELTAVVRQSEKRAPFAPENDSEHNHWSYKDVEKMAAMAGTAPLFLDADATTTVASGPIGGQTRVSLRNDHLQYVFTWYALSLATGYMFYTLLKNFKKRR